MTADERMTIDERYKSTFQAEAILEGEDRQGKKGCWARWIMLRGCTAST